LWSKSPSQAAAAFAAAFRELERIDRVFSNYRPDSELTAVNSKAAYGALSVSGEFWRMLRFAERTWEQTGRAVDPTVGPLVRAWGFHEKRATAPTATAANRAAAQVGFGGVRMGSGRRLSFDKDGMELDFGGLAKGYAAERTGAVLKRLGIGAASINLGESSIYFAGVPPLGMPWVLAVRDPEQPDRIAAVAELSEPLAVSTSATNENCTSGPGAFSHVFDCRSLLPVRGPGLSTVLMQNALDAEVASKALLIGAPNRAQQWFLLKDGVAQCCGGLLRNGAEQV
jgi:thiamine biosynthesis lipoprotein